MTGFNRYYRAFLIASLLWVLNVRSNFAILTMLTVNCVLMVRPLSASSLASSFGFLIGVLIVLLYFAPLLYPYCCFSFYVLTVYPHCASSFCKLTECSNCVSSLCVLILHTHRAFSLCVVIVLPQVASSFCVLILRPPCAFKCLFKCFLL